jgi:hypothetical protein
MKKFPSLEQFLIQENQDKFTIKLMKATSWLAYYQLAKASFEQFGENGPPVNSTVIAFFAGHGGNGFNTRIFGGEYNSLYFKLIRRNLEPVTRKETESISLVEKETWWREIVSIDPITEFGTLPDFIKRRNNYSDLELMAKHISGL